MQRTMQKSEELYIENPKLDHKLCQDLINYDIIYIQASLGWGKYTFLSHFSEHHPEYTIQMLDIYNIDQQLSELPVKDGQILLTRGMKNFRILKKRADCGNGFRSRVAEKSMYLHPRSRCRMNFWHTRFPVVCSSMG